MIWSVSFDFYNEIFHTSQTTKKNANFPPKTSIAQRPNNFPTPTTNPHLTTPALWVRGAAQRLNRGPGLRSHYSLPAVGSAKRPALAVGRGLP